MSPEPVEDVITPPIPTLDELKKQWARNRDYDEAMAEWDGITWD